MQKKNTFKKKLWLSRDVTDGGGSAFFVHAATFVAVPDGYIETKGLCIFFKKSKFGMQIVLRAYNTVGSEMAAIIKDGVRYTSVNGALLLNNMDESDLVIMCFFHIFDLYKIK